MPSEAELELLEDRREYVIATTVFEAGAADVLLRELEQAGESN